MVCEQTQTAGGRKRKSRREKSRKTSRNHQQLKDDAPPQNHQQQQRQNPKRRRLGADSNSAAKPSFLDKMRGRLSGGHFRMLNEKLYTCSGDEAFQFFKDDPNLFNVYHTGYQEQMAQWPLQPVNIIIKWIKEHGSSLVVADFGCGSASIARNVKNKVFSIDLVSNNPSVIACDMSHTPLASSSVDVAVFCLSLMGTNYPSYLQEANRVLKPRGWLLIAEVRSRFDPNNGGADPDDFCKAVNKLGFGTMTKDLTNRMFALLYFQKKEKTPLVKDIGWPELKPCIYKRR